MMKYNKNIEDINKNITSLSEIMRFNDNEKAEFYNEFNTVCHGYNYTPAIHGVVPRIVVIGDIHGDYNLAINLLKASKVMTIQNDKYIWTGGSTYVVQVGDQIDRCRPLGNMGCNNPNTTFNDEASDIKILEMFTNLHQQAINVGGAVISLLGNHELMNVMGQMQYVSYKGLEEFANYSEDSKKFNSGIEARTYAFSAGHKYGKLLGCTRVPALIIGSNLFVHAGVIDGLIKEIGLRGIDDFESINIAVRKWLLGMINHNYVKNIINGSKRSMFWTRVLGSIPPNVELDHPICMKNIKNVLKLFKVGNIIVGHTPQSFINSDDINGTCGETVWRVDNGSSSAFHRFDSSFTATGKISYSRRAQYLEIINDTQFRVCDIDKCS